MCSCCICCCCENSSDTESLSSWVSGKFKKNSEETVEQIPTITTIENMSVKEECSNVTTRPPTRQSCPPSPATVVIEQSRRGSLLSESTFGDVPYLDLRLGLFEDDRFKDASEAIFKKHS